MRFKAELEITVPDNADFYAIEDAKLQAEQYIEWRRVIDREERMRKTDLTDKCGSCKYFQPKPDLFSCAYGKCLLGHKGYKTRAYPKCKGYERRENCTE